MGHVKYLWNGRLDVLGFTARERHCSLVALSVRKSPSIARVEAYTTASAAPLRDGRRVQRTELLSSSPCF